MKAEGDATKSQQRNITCAWSRERNSYLESKVLCTLSVLIAATGEKIRDPDSVKNDQQASIEGRRDAQGNLSTLRYKWRRQD